MWRRNDLDGVRLVHFDANDRFIGAEFLPHDFGTLEQRLGAFHHQAMIVGQVGLAFGAIDQQLPDTDAFGHRQLDVRRKGGATHADDARHLHGLDEGVQRHLAPVRHAVDIDLLPGKRIGLDADGRREAPVDATKIADLRNGSGDRAVQRRRHEAAGFRDQLTTPDALADRHHGLARHADMLAERHDVVFDERHALYRQIRGLLLQMRRMHAVLETAAQLAEQLHSLRLASAMPARAGDCESCSRSRLRSFPESR